jgi:hypothetical protein
MAMEPIDLSEARQIAEDKDLDPARIKGTDIVQFTKEGGDRFEVLDWNDFEETLQNRGLKVFESSGWMKIMEEDEG